MKLEIYPVASLQGNNEGEGNYIAQEIRVDCFFMKIRLYAHDIDNKASFLLAE
jgi:hypothetical protein